MGATKKPWMFVCCSCFLLLIIGWSYAKPSATPDPQTAGRYNLITSRVVVSWDGPVTADVVFMVDSQTGRVWEYKHDRTKKSAGAPEAFLPAHFDAIFVDNLSGNYQQHVADLNNQLLQKK